MNPVDLADLADERGSTAALAALLESGPPDLIEGRYLLIPATHLLDGAVRVGEVATDTEALAVVRVTRPGAASPSWRRGVVAIRLGLSRRLLRLAALRMRTRRIGDESGLNLPPVRLAIAETELAHGQVEQLLLQATPLSDPQIELAHALLDDAGRRSLHLFGAAGYVDDAPGRLAECLSLLGHVEGASGGC